MDYSIQNKLNKVMYRKSTFFMRSRWKKKSSPKGTEASNATIVQMAYTSTHIHGTAQCEMTFQEENKSAALNISDSSLIG
jgi:hypothetical protein